MNRKNQLNHLNHSVENEDNNTGSYQELNTLTPAELHSLAVKIPFEELESFVFVMDFVRPELSAGTLDLIVERCLKELKNNIAQNYNAYPKNAKSAANIIENIIDSDVTLPKTLVKIYEQYIEPKKTMFLNYENSYLLISLVNHHNLPVQIINQILSDPFYKTLDEYEYIKNIFLLRGEYRIYIAEKYGNTELSSEELLELPNDWFSELFS